MALLLQYPERPSNQVPDASVEPDHGDAQPREPVPMPLLVTTRSAPGSDSAAARVVALLTLAFWLAVIGWLILGSSLADDLIGVAAIFAVYAVMLLGSGLLIDARDHRGHQLSQLTSPHQPRQVRSCLGAVERLTEREHHP